MTTPTIRTKATSRPTSAPGVTGIGQHYIGVMADEALDIHPEAVITMPNGFMAVNYAALGIKLKKVA